ncbi:MAG: cation diffusion facilitator family transporter, partial [Thermodesulfobacteriota bacterium]
ITVAVFAAVLGFQIIKSSIERILKGGDGLSITWFVLLVPVITILVKTGMAFYFSRVGKAARSPAIRASAVDSLSDVFVALAALIGIVGAKFGYTYLDPAAGLAISVWIIYAGYRIGMENIDYLMGKSPDKAMMEEIKAAALGVLGVKDINTVRAHYIGPFIHVEIHIEVPKYLSTFDSHAISKEVERAIGKISAIEKAFVHIDPV